MVRVTSIDKGHNFLCIVNKIVIQTHFCQNSVLRIFVNQAIIMCCSAVGYMYVMKKGKVILLYLGVPQYMYY